MVTMESHASPTIATASRAELPDVLHVQRAAFSRVARMYDIPPERLSAVSETVPDLESLMDGGFVFWLARVDGRSVGTVRAEVRDDGVVEVGRLAVEDGFEGRGIATALMGAVERFWPRAHRIELFTGAMATGPLALYGKLGYGVFEKPGELREGIVWLAKER